MKPRIFISAVSAELKSARQLVANTLLALGYEPIWQNIFGTEPGDLRQVLRDKIDSCDGLLQLVGDAYGAEPPEPDPEFGRVSYTQFEFWYARKAGKKSWLIVTEAGVRDQTPAECDLPAGADPQQPAATALTDQAERRQWQAEYLDRLRGLGHLRHKAANDDQLQLRIQEMKDELKSLRHGFQRWQRAVLIALVVLLALGGGLWATVSRQHADVKQGQQQLQQTIQETAEAQAERIADELADLRPEKIKSALRKTIEETYQQELAEAEQLKDWKKRDEAKQEAAAARDKRLSQVDGFLASITSTIQSGDASPEFLELTRIIQEQGVDEALAYITSQESRLLDRAEKIAADKQRELRQALAPLLEGVRLHQTRGEYVDARTQCEKVLAIDPLWPDALHEQYRNLIELGDRALRYETLSNARLLYQSAHNHARRLASGTESHPQAQRDLSISYNKLGDVSVQAGNLTAAREFYQQDLALAEKLSAADPTNAQAQRDLSISYDRLADVSVRAGDLTAAREFYQQGLALAEKLSAADPTNAQAQRDLSVSYNKLGDVSVQVGDLTAAREFYQQGLALAEKLSAADPTDAQAQRDLSISYNKLGNVSLQAGDLTAAREFYQQGLVLREKLSAGRVALGHCRPRAPTDPYVLALEHTVLQIRGSLRDGR